MSIMILPKKAIILAAGRGKRLKRLTELPKCLLKVNGEPLIARYIAILRACGVREILIVAGYKADKVKAAVRRSVPKVTVVENPEFNKGSILSLWQARKQLAGEVMILDGDLYFEEEFIRRAVRSRKKDFFLIDRRSAQDKEAVVVGFRKGRALGLARGLTGRFAVLGEWAGVLRLSSSAASVLRRLLERLVSEKVEDAGYEFIIPLLFKRVALSYELVDDLKWVEIDFPKDFRKALNLSKGLR